MSVLTEKRILFLYGFMWGSLVMSWLGIWASFIVIPIAVVMLVISTRELIALHREPDGR